MSEKPERSSTRSRSATRRNIIVLAIIAVIVLGLYLSVVFTPAGGGHVG